MRSWPYLRALPGCSALEWKESYSETPPFGRMKVRLKREIVTMGQPDINPLARVGHYVDAADWNALIADPDVAVIDTRNDYEVAIGTFQGAVDPETHAFGEFPAWWEAEQRPLCRQTHRDVLHRRHPLRKIHQLPAGAGG